MKLSLFFAFSLLLLVHTTTLPISNPPLKHKIFPMIDGFPFGVDWQTIKDLVHGRNEVSKVQHGAKKRDHREGLYVFRGSRYCVHTLVEYENKAIEKNDIIILEDLAQLMREIKITFVEIMKPFLARLQSLPVRTTHEIMQEWAELHNRHDSLVMEWSKNRTQNEIELFESYVKSYKDLDQACSDIISFLEDVIKSCPIGYQQYLDIVHQKKS